MTSQNRVNNVKGNEMKEITLKLEGGNWFATFSDKLSLMDEETIMTPFMAGYDVQKMINVISNRNPGYTVSINN